MRFVPFYFDSNSWFGPVDNAMKWVELVAAQGLDDVLNAKMAPVMEIDETPEKYHLGSMDVRSGKMRSFGFRREHQNGTVTLEQWSKNRGMDLRGLGESRPIS